MEIAVAIVGSLVSVVVSVALYFAGVRQGRLQERARREHELTSGHERQRHERPTEAERRRREMISKVADEYVTMVRDGFDSGPHALARIGLEALASDADIREAIDEMRARAGAGRSPWRGEDDQVEDIDLVEFFRHVREHGVNFFRVSVKSVAEEVRRQGHLRLAADGPSLQPKSGNKRLSD